MMVLGIGLLFGCAVFLFKWGPCGPSSIWGLIFMLAAMVCFAVGLMFVVAGVFKKLLERIRPGTA
jgi:hypothetical protein